MPLDPLISGLVDWPDYCRNVRRCERQSLATFQLKDPTLGTAYKGKRFSKTPNYISLQYVVKYAVKWRKILISE